MSYLLVDVLQLQALLFGVVPQLGKPLEEQRVGAGGQGAFPTQPDLLRGGHPFGPGGRGVTYLNIIIYTHTGHFSALCLLFCSTKSAFAVPSFSLLLN